LLRINGTLSNDWQYVRRPALESFPWHDIRDPETIRCGFGANTSGNQTETAVILAGDTIGLRVGQSLDVSIYHPGPAYAYLSRSPAELESYQGDGTWFKIGQYGIVNASRWEIDSDYQEMNFTIPVTTPPGKYLFRAEQLYMLFSGLDGTGLPFMQFYINCAHIEVKGSGGGIPGPLVKFPGAYATTDRG
ncbi:hypothetical protein EJ04DRAFT_393495, partial [Polyplosphaeria fusca]